MNKTIFQIALLSAGIALTGCIKETFPMSSTATADQVGESSSALEASVRGISSQMTQSYYLYGSDTQQETDLSIAGLMITYTELMGDILPQGTNTGYDWFRSFNAGNSGLGANTYNVIVPWRTLYNFVKSANDLAGSLEGIAEPSEVQKGYLGIAYTIRAWAYWQLAGIYTPVENIYTDVSNVLGLTVPIITNNTTEEEGGNNPRVSVEAMKEFILADLDNAETLLADFTPESRTMPGLDVVYGMKARVYLWFEDYANAATYARKAIDESKRTPLTSSQWEDPTTGFNSASSNSSWMWYTSYSAENMGNLANFTGWMAGEADWGYNSLNHYGINRWIYDRISATDFRKHSFIDPDRYDFYSYKFADGYEDSYSLDLKENDEYVIPDYTSYKFRCVEGNFTAYETGGACDLPLMRVEEMYLIEAEALGMSQGESAGIEALTSFMTSYRDASYTYALDEIVNSFQKEVLFQKRVELWGEGWAFFDAKRIKAGSYQWYAGSNAKGEILHINAVGIKPQWTMMIPQSEVNNNVALTDLNNPDPTGKCDPDTTTF